MSSHTSVFARQHNPGVLLAAARAHIADPAVTTLALHGRPDQRVWRELAATETLQIWAIAWPPGTSTGWHDHGDAAGGFVVAQGALTELWWDAREHLATYGPLAGRAFSAPHIHDVRNTGDVSAVSVHAYSPRLTTMTRYDVGSDGPRVSGRDRVGEAW